MENEEATPDMHYYRVQMKPFIGPEGRTTRAKLVRQGHCTRRQFDVNWQAKELTADVEIFFDGLLEHV